MDAAAVHGASTTTCTHDMTGISFGAREAFDVYRVCEHMRGTYKHVIAMGTSVGGGACIIAAGMDAERNGSARIIDGVVAENPVADRPRLCAPRLARRIRHPAQVRRGIRSQARQLHRRAAPRATAAAVFVCAWTGVGRGAARCVAAHVSRRCQGHCAPHRAQAPAAHALQGRRRGAAHPLSGSVCECSGAWFMSGARVCDAAQKPKALWLADSGLHTGLYDAHPAEFRRRFSALLVCAERDLHPDSCCCWPRRSRAKSRRRRINLANGFSDHATAARVSGAVRAAARPSTVNIVLMRIRAWICALCQRHRRRP